MPSGRAAERKVSAVERVPERWIERGLRPDDLDRRLARTGGDRIAGDEPAAADGNDQRVEVGGVFQHFERDGALAGDHQRIVIGVDEGQAALARDGLRAHLRLRHAFAVEHDLGAVGLRGLDLHERRRHRHDDGGRDRQARGVVGDRLRVVARRHGDDAAFARRRIERGELVERAAVLERVGDLQVLVFDEDLGAGQRREFRRRQHRRAQHVPGDGAARRYDVGNGHAHASSPARSPATTGTRRYWRSARARPRCS